MMNCAWSQKKTYLGDVEHTVRTNDNMEVVGSKT